MFLPINRWLPFSLLLLLPLSVLALQSDQKKPLNITSDTALFSKDQHITIFTGDVIGIQGTSRVTGTKLFLYLDKQNKKIERAIAFGNPATYSTLMDDKKKKQQLIAKADIITYFPQKDYVTLKGHAFILKGQDKMEGNFITYNLKKQVVESKSTGKQKRTTITIQPKDLN